jgi:glycosyltransferase involved in cell wall biosynthesis
VRPRTKANIALLRQGSFPADPRVRKEVAALLEAGHSVDVICRRGDGEARVEAWRGATVHRLDVASRRGAGLRGQLIEYGEFLARATTTLARLQRRREFALVQVNTLPDFLSCAALSARLRGSAVLLDMHELMPEFFAASYGGRGARALLRTARVGEWLATRPADHVLFVSPLQETIMARRVGRPSTVIPNTPDEALFHANGRSPGRDDPAVVLTHGTVAERYGAQLLIEALPTVLREMPAEAWIVGDGDHLAALRARAQRLGIERQVRFTGRVELEAVPELISQARVGVVPLLPGGYAELMSPNKLFEYVAMERPTVCADLPGVRTYVSERETEFFTPGDPAHLAQKLLLVLGDRQRSAELVSEASRLYERLRWRVTGPRYLRVVDGLIAGGHGASRAA